MQTLKFGASGGDVGALHQALIEAGYTVDASELTLAKFLGSTALAVRQFQSAHGLAADAIVGAQTWAALNGQTPGQKFQAPGWKYDPSQVREDLRPVTDAAVSQIGVQEIDSSNVIPGDPYGADQHGQPWCAYGISWCFGKYAGGSPFGVLASAFKFFEYGKSHNAILSPGDRPRPGDVFGILRGDYHGHVGLIVNVADAGSLTCVEFNSSNACRGTFRNRAGVTFIVRPVK